MDRRREGGSHGTPQGRGPQAGPFGPGLITSITLMEMPLGLARPERDGTKPKRDAREAGSCLGLRHSGSQRPGPGLGPACYCVAGNKLVSAASDKGHGSLSPLGKGVLRAERPGQ